MQLHVKLPSVRGRVCVVWKTGGEGRKVLGSFFSSRCALHACTNPTPPPYNIIKQGKVITLDVERTDKTQSVKQMIQEKESISPDQQRLVYRKELEDEHTLSDYHVSSGSTLHVVRGAGKSMQIFVKTLTDKKFTLELNSGNTVLNMKEKIKARKAPRFFHSASFTTGRRWRMTPSSHIMILKGVTSTCCFAIGPNHRSS